MLCSGELSATADSPLRTWVQDMLRRSRKWERTGVTLIMCPTSCLRLEEMGALLIILVALLGHSDGGVLGD